MTMHLGIIGYGSIGQAVVEGLGDQARRVTLLVRPDARVPGPAGLQTAKSPDALIAARPDLIVECAGHDAVRDAVVPALRAGIDCIIASVGALADPALEAAVRSAAAEGGAQAVLPAGAIGGIDLLSALAQAGAVRVTYRGTKPPAAWAGTAAGDMIDLSALTGPATFFAGTARTAARLFPKNANVAATLALAGAGLDATTVELVADPAAPGNLHAYSVTSALGSFDMRIRNAATPGNPRTSATTIQSVLRAIRNRSASVVI